MAKRVKIPGRLESAETGNIVTGADAVMDDEKGKTQVVINSEVDAAIINLAQGKQDNLTFDSAPTEDSPNPVTSAGVYTADKVLSDAIEAILLLIPSAASALNKLVDMQTMNSSIATATASFKGTYNLVSDLHLGVDATHEQIGAALDALSLGADNNDYAFVQVPNSATAPTEISKTERYKFNGENWLFEYDLNNSGFTQGQWNAINSGVTSLLVSKLSDLPTNAELTTLLAGKQDNLTFDNVPTAGSPNPVKSGGVYARNNEIVALINALDAAKQDVLTFDNAPVEGSPNPVKSGGVYTAISAVQAAIVALDAAKQNVLTFDSTPTLGSPNPVTSSGIKTELNRIDGDIMVLDNLYRALTQSSLVVVAPTDTWPVASPSATTIYRVVDRDHTPPQYYSDYMFSGSTPVLMAQYDNAIDDVPTAGSNNLVKSGGVAEMYGHYEECPQYIHVKTDFYGRIMWAIKKDGGIYWGAGLPQQILDLVERLSLDRVDDILAYLDNLDETKSIINADYASSMSASENPEFLSVETDSDDRVIAGRKADGTKVENVGIKTPVISTDLLVLSKNAMEHLVNNLEESGFTPGTIPTKTSQLTNDSGFITSSEIQPAVPSVIQGNNNPVTSNGVFDAIQQAQILAAQVTINTGLPYIVVASSMAPREIKDVCQYVCDGVDDQVEINAAIQSVKDTGGKIFLTRGKYYVSSPIIFEGNSELCGEGAGCIFSTSDPVLRTGSVATILQATNNVDVIRVMSGRGYSMHDFGISGFGIMKAQTTHWGIKIMGWADLGNFYNLEITDCYVGIGNNVYTDVFTIHDCSIQRNKMACLFYKGCGLSLYNCIFCENEGLDHVTSVFSDTPLISEGTERTYEVMSIISIINSKGLTHMIHDNLITRCGFAFDFTTDPIEWTTKNDLKPIAGISIVGATATAIIQGNHFLQTLGPAIKVYKDESLERRFTISNNVFHSFGLKYMEYTDSEYNEDESNAAAIVLNARTTVSTITNNTFVRETSYSNYAVYENICSEPNNMSFYSVSISGNTMFNLLGTGTERCKIIGTGSGNWCRNNNYN